MRLVPLLWVAIMGCGEVIPVKTDATACFDGEDNEGSPNQLADCADPGCGDVATCVESTDNAGVVVDADQPCPAGFEGGETVLHRGLRPGACEGCGCAVGETQCTAQLWSYSDNNTCVNDIGLSGGSMLGISITTSCTADPIYYTTSPGGLRADITATPLCTPTGAALPAAPEWMESTKFCAASRIGAGCTAGQACVPKAAAPAAQCVLATEGATCSSFATAEEWYTGADDQRTCGACFCSGVGGDCSGMVVEIGSDYSCGAFGNNLADNTTLCFNNNAPYSPSVRLIGTSTPPVGCTSDATPSGMIVPTGETTLCCGPQ
jgi:hypothetical protein